MRPLCYSFPATIFVSYSSASLLLLFQSLIHPSESNQMKSKLNQIKLSSIELYFTAYPFLSVCLHILETQELSLSFYIMLFHVMLCYVMSCHIPLSAPVSVECKTGHDMMLGLESRHLWYKMSEKECQTIFLSES